MKKVKKIKCDHDWKDMDYGKYCFRCGNRQDGLLKKCCFCKQEKPKSEFYQYKYQNKNWTSSNGKCPHLPAPPK